MKGEQIPHEAGVYTATRDPSMELCWGEDGCSILVRHTHQLTVDLIDRVWELWTDTVADVVTTDLRLPPPRLRWIRQVPTHPRSLEADAGITSVIHPANPGEHGAFPAIEFAEHTLHYEKLLPPRIIDVHLPEPEPVP